MFNGLLIEAFRTSVLTLFQTNPSFNYCTQSPNTPQACLSTLLSTDVPTYVVFPLGVLGILFGAMYGIWFEYIPGVGYGIRAVGIGMVVLIVMLLLSPIGGFTTNQWSMRVAMFAFDLVAVLGYAAIIGRFYHRYTRAVKFDTPDPARLKITVDGKNYSGKTKTLSLHSTHTVRAPSESGAFHEWLVSGGISVLDSRSFETTMRVEGDGLLKIS